jgi:hypothetical protein
MDIVLAPKLGGIHYALLLTDHFSQMTYLYPLKNLTSEFASSKNISLLIWV